MFSVGYIIVQVTFPRARKNGKAVFLLTKRIGVSTPGQRKYLRMEGEKNAFLVLRWRSSVDRTQECFSIQPTKLNRSDDLKNRL